MSQHTKPAGSAAASLSVAVRFYARYAELMGTAETTVELPQPATVGSMVAFVRDHFPNGGSLPERPLVAVNEEHALPDRELAAGDLVAFLPPLAGG